MGNWVIMIEGMGAHHNTDFPKDANKMAAKFVEELNKAGHSVYRATFTHGGAERLGTENANDFRGTPKI